LSAIGLKSSLSGIILAHTLVTLPVVIAASVFEYSHRPIADKVDQAGCGLCWLAVTALSPDCESRSVATLESQECYDIQDVDCRSAGLWPENDKTPHPGRERRFWKRGSTSRQ
jgi:hypothetical protein